MNNRHVRCSRGNFLRLYSKDVCSTRKQAGEVHLNPAREARLFILEG